jgi:hypothetical protein
VKRDVLAAARFFVLPTIALVGIAVFAPGQLVLAARIYALVAGGAAITVFLLALRRAYPRETSPHGSASGPSRDARPASLARIEHETTLAAVSAFDLHYRLAPRLRAIAEGLLASRRHASLVSSSESARGILGEDVWALVRPDRPAPEDRLAGGMTPEELRRVVDALEAI